MTMMDDDNPYCEMCAKEAIRDGGVFGAERLNEESSVLCSECSEAVLMGQYVYYPFYDDDE